VTIRDPKGSGARRDVLPRNPDYVNHRDEIPKEQRCDCCGGKDQRNFDPRRYNPVLKMWLCKSCCELHEDDLVAEDLDETRPDRSGRGKVRSQRATRGGKNR
jgi:hypothetical protein